MTAENNKARFLSWYEILSTSLYRSKYTYIEGVKEKMCLWNMNAPVGNKVLMAILNISFKIQKDPRGTAYCTEDFKDK